MSRQISEAPPPDRKPSRAGRNSCDFVDVDKVFRRMKLQPDAVFLDLGCGLGGYSFIAARQLWPQGRVLAMDKWAQGINSINNQLEQQVERNIAAFCVDIAKQIPLPNNSVDVCLMAFVAHHLVAAKTIDKVLNHLNSVLRPGAKVHFIEFKKTPPPPGPPLSIRLSASQLRQWLPEQHFTLVETTDIEPHIYMQTFTYNKESTTNDLPQMIYNK
ncbi:MAG: class I SAM-dependent methyltransferase [Pseudomonadales bacterium]|nr:class I SAM-dependent methyltransferase [Pseudomonadales bacterium]